MQRPENPSAPVAFKVSEKSSAKAAHVNMMTDTIIANMPPEGLRTVLRGLLGVDPKVTLKLNALATEYLAATRPETTPQLFTTGDLPSACPALFDWQQRYRCLMGCGMGFESMKLLTEVIDQSLALVRPEKIPQESLMDLFAVVDADVIQSVTAVQKELLTTTGSRKMTGEEDTVVHSLLNGLIACKQQAEQLGQEFPFQRGLSRMQKMEGMPAVPSSQQVYQSTVTPGYTREARPNIIEHIKLGKSLVPRMFMGLWQFSSPAWGTATVSKINKHFRKHVDAGFTAYDMADHYGDAEVTFGKFRSAQPDSANIFCATKYCVFESVTITEEVIKANITERLASINADVIDLLQLHWQCYEDQQYIRMAQLVEQDPRVLNVGLCNFDTQRMNEIVESGVHIVSNQVQFSLIDLRPTFKMADSCRKNDVKLLTYGSLCGGFLADKWLNKQAPNMFGEDMTPSHRKYYEMITIWGGWELLQRLLSALSSIGKKHNVSISNVATRWVLEHDYVAATIIGGRMGISEHAEENTKAFSFVLDGEDRAAIKVILDQSRSADVFEAMGDCGAEYR
ncbi:putative oxidoreductase-like protein [Lachnellula arida]|uniref:Putative oxidoreductase-like protein n=1 Tax=Lachnellula arida TaxID=1316785 RepID=A0A8T9BJU6_9HELO|nr:putative oxidoreductase-like protein [Lachnellula arida]